MSLVIVFGTVSAGVGLLSRGPMMSRAPILQTQVSQRGENCGVVARMARARVVLVRACLPQLVEYRTNDSTPLTLLARRSGAAPRV
ncbi:MAG TPA: hypothetical protein VIV60_37110 [Polyangiaceae bacterium]